MNWIECLSDVGHFMETGVDFSQIICLCDFLLFIISLLISFSSICSFYNLRHLFHLFTYRITLWDFYIRCCKEKLFCQMRKTKSYNSGTNCECFCWHQALKLYEVTSYNTYPKTWFFGSFVNGIYIIENGTLLSLAIEQSQTFPIIIGSTSVRSRAFHTFKKCRSDRLERI